MSISSQGEVRLLDVPVAIWQRASAHQEAIQREFDILRGHLSEEAVPNRLFVLIEDLDARFANTSDQTWAELHAAAERGVDKIDLTFAVPREAAAAARQLDEMLTAVDDYCRSGEELLTLATPDELADFRRWLLGEFTRQIEEGLEPISWDAHRDGERAQTKTAQTADTNETAQPGTVVFEGDLDLVTAASLQEQIQERRAEGVNHLTLDLTGVRFMDSVGISLLVAAHNRMAEDGFSLRMVFPTRLQPLIAMSGLVDLLDPEFVDQAD